MWRQNCTAKIEFELRREYGHGIGWLANVINAWHGQPLKKVKGLRNLAKQDRVGMGNSIDDVSIDGAIVPMSRLEDHA